MIRAVQLGTMLQHCNESDLPKEVLECGCGVWAPEAEPLFVRFVVAGYQVRGIELAEDWLTNARTYCEAHSIEAELVLGDMQALPYADASISHVFSYNTIFHLPKAGIEKAVREIRRVLRSGGVCFVNFAGVDDAGHGQGEEVGRNEFRQLEAGQEVIHSYFEYDEAEDLFDAFEILRKEVRTLDRSFESGMLHQVYIDYIVRKT